MTLSAHAAEVKRKVLERYEYLLSDGLSIYDAPYNRLKEKPDDYWEERAGSNSSSRQSRYFNYDKG